MKGDIAEVVGDTGGAPLVFVPHRTSTSARTPNVSVGYSSLKPSTKEAYDLQHGTSVQDALDYALGKTSFKEVESKLVDRYKSTPKPEYDPSNYTHLKYKIGEKVMYNGKEAEVLAYDIKKPHANMPYVITGWDNSHMKDQMSHTFDSSSLWAGEDELSPVYYGTGLMESIKPEHIRPYTPVTYDMLEKTLHAFTFGTTGELDFSFLHEDEEQQLDLTIKSVKKVNI